MKFSSFTILAAALSASLVSADGAIGGNTGVKYCKGDDSRMTFDEINIEPYPPVRGNPIKITATGSMHNDLTEGAQVELHFKKGVLKKTVTKEICGMGTQVCPSNKLELAFEEDVPKKTPHGKWDVSVKVINGGGTEVGCMEGKMEIKK